MTKLELDFIRQFDDENVVALAAMEVFKDRRSQCAADLVLLWIEADWMEVRDFDGDVSEKNVLSRLLILTDDGRTACDLPRLMPVVAEKPKSKALQGELF